MVPKTPVVYKTVGSPNNFRKCNISLMNNRREYEPWIYIVLPVHNREVLTTQFANNLHRQHYTRYTLVLIDDGCRDKTVETVREIIENLVVLTGDGNLWWAGALQYAYTYLAEHDGHPSDIVLLINDDVQYDRNYLTRLSGDVRENPEAIIVSLGRDIDSDDVERGFLVDWKRLKIDRINDHTQEPDAIVTRGLYMPYWLFIELGGFYPKLLPQYLSDLEYTIRAKRKGYALHVSRNTELWLDRQATGEHQDRSESLTDFIYNQLISKKTSYNIKYWANFVLLSAPWRYKISCLLILCARFIKRLFNFMINKWMKGVGQKGF